MQNVFRTIATCLGVLPDNVTELGAGVQVRNCGWLLTQLKVTVPVKPGAAVSVSPIARVPPGDTVGVVPGLTPGGGVIVRTKGTLVTVSVVVPTMFVFPCILVAVMLVICPPVKPVAWPPSVMVAASAFDEAQATELVMSRLLLSEKVPVAVYCCFWPTTMVRSAGVTAMDMRTTGAVTVNCAVPLIVVVCVEVAVIVIGPPADTPVATPVAALIVAIPVLPDDHVTVTGPVDPSEK